jgi:hypothetical protein
VLSAPFENQTSGSPLFWQLPSGPVITTASPVTVGSAFEANTTLFPANPFPPASTFVVGNFPPGVPLTAVPMFDVTTVPEPSSLVLLGVGLVGMSLRQKRLT